MVLHQANFIPNRHLSMSGDLVVHTEEWGDAAGIQPVEAKDTVKHPAMHRTVPTTKNYPGQIVHSCETKDVYLKGMTQTVEIEDLCQASKKKYLQAVEIYGILYFTLIQAYCNPWQQWHSIEFIIVAFQYKKSRL